MSSPLGLASSATLNSQSQVSFWDPLLQTKSVLHDIYTNLEGIYNTDLKAIPESTVMVIKEKFVDGNKVIVTLLMPDSGEGVFGLDQRIGQEHTYSTKAMTIYRGQFSWPVITEAYGMHYLDQKYLGIFKKMIARTSIADKEQQGIEIRQAIVNRWGESLYLGNNNDTASLCTPRLNENIFICGGSDAIQPTFNGASEAAWPNAIGQALIASGQYGTINGAWSAVPTKSSTIGAADLTNLSNRLVDMLIDPLSLPDVAGGKGYMLVLSKEAAAFASDPAWKTNCGSLYTDIARMPNLQKMNWPGLLGFYKDIGICVDVRSPTFTMSGNAGSGTLAITPNYVRHGTTNNRNKTAATGIDVGIVLGKGAYWKSYPESVHLEEQLDDYGRDKGVASCCVRSYGRVVYDQASPTTGTQENHGSALVLMGFPQLTY